MLFNRFSIHQDVVKICNTNVIPESHYSLIDVPLERWRGIRDSHRNSYPLIQTPWSRKGSEFSKFLLHIPLMVSFGHIQCGKPFMSPQTVNNFLYVCVRLINIQHFIMAIQDGHQDKNKLFSSTIILLAPSSLWVLLQKKSLFLIKSTTPSTYN